MQDWFSIKIYNIYNNILVKFVVVLKRKLKSTRSFAIYLALVAISSKIFNSLLLNIVARPLKNSYKILYG